MYHYILFVVSMVMVFSVYKYKDHFDEAMLRVIVSIFLVFAGLDNLIMALEL